MKRGKIDELMDAIGAIDEELIADMKDKGVTFVEDVDIAEWQDATASVYDQFADQLPQDILEAFRSIQ